MVPASLQGTHQLDLGPKRVQGDPGQSPDQDLNLDQGQGGVLVDIIQDHVHVLDPTEDQEADLIAANPDPNCCLGVFGLSLYTTERDLREVFNKYGPIADVSIVYDQQSRRSRGFAFVYFESVDDAKEAKERANGMELDGRRIRVDFSITKRPHTPTPGIYMGRPT
ncbi:hypothetical protein JD844_007121 [Phrynosoma platyrhinos]|uniref:RRM domain-containing protein n=1 Tax=Phrynosoma platyrhinos TaxID=52577 RepID=A0ABQ7T2H5_PHRPL|nr:hypothetical protein JD844_007121 [Phrynosoma platyrhinos]